MRTALFVAALAWAQVAVAAPLETEGERSSWARTGKLDEVVRLCAEAERLWPRRARCLRVGESPERRPLMAIVASADGVLDPAQARQRKRPVMLVIGGIHPGEIDGKDAGFLVLRGLFDGTLAKGALSAVTLVFVPVFNVDGHERPGRWNRPNQRGPEEQGFRATAQNLNLNRDWVKADAPETRLMLGLVQAWDPTVTVDLHVTDGSKFEHDVSVAVSPKVPRVDGLHQVAAKISAGIQERLAASGHLPIDFYPQFVKNDEPASGFPLEDGPPRFSDNYAAARNRLAVLVETHSWKTYGARVMATRDSLVAVLEQAVTDAPAWRAAEEQADAVKLAGSEVALFFKADPAAGRMIDFRGFAYTVSQSEVSGSKRIVYDESKPQVWRVPLFDKLEPKLVVRAPRGGYIVPVAFADRVEARLRLHGVRFERIAGPRTVAAEIFAIDELTYEKPFEGRLPVKVVGAWRAAERVPVRAGSLFVPIDQPRARLVLQMLEPEAADSFTGWGDFNAVFEQKEYIEPYVLEDEAREMLARDKPLADAFAKRLREDAKFAADPKARLRWFEERHPTFEKGTRSVPVLRVDARP